ncbi:D-sedoheptulose-7-phosphate isomerase [Desulfatibacillum aliphaticivorans]|uniref:D-sedoheptulose-7-phosphate isomerase n=1 Tax=Desulfatibacillum aliphaticivorans TaxID=218208 RepID=UPI00040F563A|nr:SIS domain-containing protein [Desulfatibacillum aliphaticivorans]
MQYFSQQYLEGLKAVLDDFPHEAFEKMIAAMLDAYEKGRRIFVMGNGGSASTASHWVCDINKGCCLSLEKKFRMICLNDSISTMMAYANDLSYDDVFVEPLKNFFEPGDVVIGISGSGNSTNVLKAIEYANQNGGVTIGLCGYGGGKLKDLASIPVHSNVNDMQMTEDAHMIVVHISMQRIMKALGQEGAAC